MDKQRKLIAGFTLVEMMLVLVVIALMASLLTATLSDNPAGQLNREAKRLQAVINLAAEEAVLQGIEFSLVLNAQVDTQSDTQGIDVNGYQFVRLNLDDLSWQTIDEPTYRFHPLPAAITIELRLEDDNQHNRALLDRQAELIRRSNTSQQLQPAVLLLSSGEMTPFTLLLRHADSEQPEILTSDGIAGVERR